MQRQKYINDIDYLDNRSSTRRGKYRRNLRTYYHTFGLGMTNIDDTNVVGYYNLNQFDNEEDTTSGIQENVIKSTIDTLVSNIASKKVRPYFSTLNGTFKDMQVVRQAQQFFDNLYDEQNVNKIVTDVFKDACIFEMGCVYIDRETHKISRILPWQISFDNKEFTYNKLTRIVWKMDNYPLTLFPFPVKKSSLSQNVTYYRYYNILDHKLVHYAPEIDFYKEETWEVEALPFLFMFYDNPIKSGTTASVVDQLIGLQEAIDELIIKIKDASQLGSPLRYFVPENSSIKVSKLSNRIGEIITYTPIPNQTTPPIVTAAEPFMDPQWIEMLEKFKNDAFEVVGAAQLNVNLQKPKGLDSGVAIDTYEDIADARFEIQLNNVIHMYTEIAKLCMDVFSPDEDILPANRLRKSIQWKDVVELRNNMKVQFSAAESLSKEPAQRAAQVNMLVQMGAIPQSRVASLMEIPDSVQGYSLANNAISAVMDIIDETLDSRVIKPIPDFIPTDMLKEEILNTCLSLKAASNNNSEDIDLLLELYQSLINKEMDSQTSAEMVAAQSLNDELMQDIENPNGAYNTAFNQAMNSNIKGEE